MSTNPHANATLVSLFYDRVNRDGEKLAIQFHQGSVVARRTWNDLADDIARLAAGLVRHGVKPGDRVVQVSENRYEWLVLDLAIHFARGVHVAVHSTLSGPQIADQIADSGAALVIVSGPQQAEKFATTELPRNVTFFSHDPCSIKVANQAVRPLTEIVMEISGEADTAIAHNALAAVQPDDLATILYTSGTTGEPKGVMLSHGNLASNALATIEAFGYGADDLRLCWLPLSHIFARTCDLYTWFACGHELALAQSRDTIIADCATFHPTVMNGVPYFYEKVHRTLTEQGQADVPGRLQQVLGGRMRICCSGGAPLPDHLAEFYNRNGVVLVQGYGLTESSPVIAASSSRANRLGTVGLPIPGVEVKIAEDGEILTRGPHVMLGYWNRLQDTAEAIQDGWLRTGDLGRLEGGYLRITGRKKELIVTSAGKNIAPSAIEALLVEDPLVAQAMVVGDGRNYLAALVVPNPAALREEIARLRIPVASPAETLVHPQVRELYAQRINERLSGLSPHEQIRTFTLLDRGFTIESGELTPTLKLRRGIVAANFAEVIRAMYESPGQDRPCDV